MHTAAPALRVTSHDHEKKTFCDPPDHPKLIAAQHRITACVVRGADKILDIVLACSRSPDSGLGSGLHGDVGGARFNTLCNIPKNTGKSVFIDPLACPTNKG